MAASLVQSVAGNHTGANTATVVANIAATSAGNLLVVYAIGSQITATTYAVSVSGGTTQTFTVWPNSPNAAQTGLNLNCWYVLACAAGTTQITITRSSGTGQSAVIVEEWTGGTFAAGLGATSSGTLTTTLITGTTASQSVDLVLACVTDTLGTSQPTLSAPTNGFTAQTFATGDNAPTNTAFKGLQSLNKITSSTGTFSTGMTASVTPDAYAGMILGFTLAGSSTTALMGSPPRVWVPRGNPFILRIQQPFMSAQRLAYPALPAAVAVALVGTSNAVSTASATIYQPGLVVTTETQSGITGGPPGNNSTQTTVSWKDLSGNGWAVGMIPAYGGALISPWYELDSGVRSITQTSLSTSNPDGFIHALAQSGTPPGPANVFAGTEDPTFTLTEIGPTGQAFRRYYDSGTISTANPALNWRVRTAVYPGDPGHYYHRIDITNPSGSAVNLNGGDGLEIAMLGGLTQALQGGSSAWIPGNGLYATVGGSETAWPGPEPTTTVADPDYVYVTATGGSGLKLAAVCVRANASNGGQSIAALTGASNAQITYLTNANRLKVKVRVDMSSFPGSTTMTLYYVESRPRNIAAGQAASIAADYLNPDAASIVSLGTAASPFFSLDEGAYVIAASGNVVKLTHTFPTNVTKRWTLNYKITGYTSTSAPIVTVAGNQLDNLSALTYVDTANQIAYVVLMPALVASGAVAPDLNNGQIVIQQPAGVLSGASSSLSSGSGSLGLAEALATTTPASTTASAALSVAAALQGSTPAAATAKATLAEQVALASSAAVTSTGSASLSQQVALTGSSSALSTGTGALTVPGTVALAGSSASVSNQSATLGLAEALTGSAITLSAASANLQTLSGLQIAGTSTGLSTAGATLGLGLGLGSTSPAISRATATLVVAVALLGSADSKSLASALLGVLGLVSPGSVGAADQLVNSVGAQDQAVSTVGVVDQRAASTGAADHP